MLKIHIYLKSLFRLIFTNKARFILTIIGFIIGNVIFSFGNIILDSYYSGKMKAVDEMSENAIIFSSEKKYMDVFYDDMLKKTSSPLFYQLEGQTVELFSSNYCKDYKCTLNANIIGVSGGENIYIENNEDSVIASYRPLIKGRSIYQSDIVNAEKVAIIDELSEKMMFSDKNAIGKNISIYNPETDEFEDYKVVGVLKKSFYNTLEEINLKNGLQSSNKHISITSTIYIPSTSAKNMFNNNSMDKAYYLFDCESKDNISQTENICKDLGHIFEERQIQYQISDKKILTDKYENEYQQTKTFMNILLIIIIFISGLSVMSIIFFSVKERISEIGVRKTLGASRLDIFLQFILEGFIISVISAFISLTVSIVATQFTEYYLLNVMYIFFDISYTPKNIISSISMCIAQGTIFSSIPALYATKISVVTALKFE